MFSPHPPASSRRNATPRSIFFLPQEAPPNPAQPQRPRFTPILPDLDLYLQELSTIEGATSLFQQAYGDTPDRPSPKNLGEATKLLVRLVEREYHESFHLFDKNNLWIGIRNRLQQSPWMHTLPKKERMPVPPPLDLSAIPKAF